MGYKKDYKVQRGGHWYYQRRVPKDVAHLDRRGIIRQALRTTDEATARLRAQATNQATEEFWEDLLRHGRSDDGLARYDAAVRLARNMGFAYRPAREIATGPLDDVRRRLQALEARGEAVTEAEVDALLGGVEKPALTVSGMLEAYEAIMSVELRGKDDRAKRRWRNPRRKATEAFASVVADRRLDEITREDAIEFRKWWQDRVLGEELTAGAANKDIGHLARMFAALNEHHSLGLANPFERMRLSEKGDQGKRLPFEPAYCRKTLLTDASLSGLNEEARAMLRAMFDTGAGIGELSGLEPGDIALDHDVPHIRIRANRYRGLKTPQRERDIPLIGYALAAFQACPEGFPRYRGKQDSASSAIGKYLRENKLVKGGQTAYSLRHTFEDRLTAVATPDRIAADLMGHSYHRPRYGHGPSLALKLEWLRKIEG